jgi:hypothetical protein
MGNAAVSASAEMKILTDRNGLFIALSGLLKRSMLRAYAVHQQANSESTKTTAIFLSPIYAAWHS